MFNKLALVLLSAALATACGDGKSPTPKVSTGAPEAPAASDGPTIVADQPVPASERPNKPTNKSKKPSPKPNPAPAQPPVVPVATVQPVVNQNPAPPQPVAPVIPPQVAPSPYVIGMGSTGEKPEALNSNGPNFAIQKAQFCAVSHQYPGGDKCYLVYSDGSTKWSDSRNYNDAEVFIEKLKAQRNALKASKKRKTKG